MKPLSKSRPTSKLSRSVHHQLNMYALVTTAAGVSLLALAVPAECKIVHKVVNQKLPINDEFFLDLNNDTRNDFMFVLHSFNGASISHSLGVNGLRGNGILDFMSHSHQCAKALPKGVKVGPGNQFDTKAVMGFEGSSMGGSFGFCTWQKVTTQAFVGLKFSIAGRTHFGWARFGGISLGPRQLPTATLIDYAYETTPDKAIVTGRTKERNDSSAGATPAALSTPTREPATLGVLALGSRPHYPFGGERTPRERYSRCPELQVGAALPAGIDSCRDRVNSSTVTLSGAGSL
jgi:hypothetical protein